jgi:hypothetical protein
MFSWRRAFADRIAALAVQEVEREHDARTFELECAKGDIATLTAQLAEARQSIAEEEARADAIAAHRDAYRAQLATAKREADEAVDAAFEEMRVGFFSNIEIQGARCLVARIRERLVPATPSPEAREVLEYVDLRVSGALNALGDRCVRITPADAKRIGIMGGWRE